MFFVSPAALSDVDAAAEVLAEAFEGDAVLGAVTGDPRPDRERLAAFFAPLLRSGGLPHGGVQLARADEDGQVLGVAVWEPPGARGHLGRQLRELPGFMRALQLRGLRSALRVQSLLDRHRPRAPHWYLAQIGVSTQARGLGVGSALVEAQLATADRDGDGAYLESSNERNRRLYLRLGFRPTATITGVPGAEPVAMWRAPRLAGTTT
jgi:ribosomal protein S18 acetylase RimI-like enzyme